MKYICVNCGYIYNPEMGDEMGSIAPDTPFEDLPENWICPLCYAPKEAFDPLD